MAQDPSKGPPDPSTICLCGHEQGRHFSGGVPRSHFDPNSVSDCIDCTNCVGFWSRVQPLTGGSPFGRSPEPGDTIHSAQAEDGYYTCLCGHSSMAHGKPLKPGDPGSACTRCVNCRGFYNRNVPPPEPQKKIFGIPRSFLSGAVLGALGMVLVTLFSNGLSLANYALTRRQTAAMERMADAFERGAQMTTRGPVIVPDPQNGGYLQIAPDNAVPVRVIPDPGHCNAQGTVCW